jgi:hypothetical protein
MGGLVTPSVRVHDARDLAQILLDGARYLDRWRWPARLSALVAHHSCAHFVATVRDLRAELDEYSREESAVSDAFTYADQTVGRRTPCPLAVPARSRRAGGAAALFPPGGSP